MGSYHIIDGEKVSVRYNGQEWTCARCHQLKNYFPGLAVARNCTADRVLLSEHMREHWEKIAFKPETDTLNEVDEEEPAIQVGSIQNKSVNVPDTTLTSKYCSLKANLLIPRLPPPSPPGQARSSSSGPATQSLETQFIFDPPISPNVKEQVSDIEKKGGAQELCGMTPLDNKRKNDGSPEASGLSRKEKKIQKSEEKKIQKSKSKETKANRTVQVQKTF